MNTKTLILKERVKAAWIVTWLVLIIINILVYINDPLSLSVDSGSDFKDWVVKFLSPHNWLGLATFLLTLYGVKSIWLICEQNWPMIKDFRFVPIITAITAILVFVGVAF